MYHPVHESHKLSNDSATRDDLPACATAHAVFQSAQQDLARMKALQNTGFRGNKAGLPSKPCVSCGRPMSWRRSWAKNWSEVKYCCEACRRGRVQYG